MHKSSFYETIREILVKTGFVVEHSVKYGSGRGQRYSLDFAHLEGKVAIEVDGATHRSRPFHRVRDRKKDQFLRRKGWRVIRVPERDYKLKVPPPPPTLLDKKFLVLSSSGRELIKTRCKICQAPTGRSGYCRKHRYKKRRKRGNNKTRKDV